MRPITPAAKATILRILLRDGPQPASRFKYHLAVLRACIAQRTVGWATDAPATVRATGLAAPWLESHTLRTLAGAWRPDRRPLAVRALERRQSGPAPR